MKTIKLILFLILLSFGFQGLAQNPTQIKGAARYRMLGIDDIFSLPNDTLTPGGYYNDRPNMAIVNDSILFIWDATLKRWRLPRVGAATITWADIVGDPHDNPALADSLGTKQQALPTGVQQEVITGDHSLLNLDSILQVYGYLKTTDTIFDAIMSGSVDSMNFINGLYRVNNNVMAYYWQPMWNANMVQGKFVEAVQPKNGNFLGYDSLNNVLRWLRTDSVLAATFEETDPLFVASPAAGITPTDITNWNTRDRLGLEDETAGEDRYFDVNGHIFSIYNSIYGTDFLLDTSIRLHAEKPLFSGGSTLTIHPSEIDIQPKLGVISIGTLAAATSMINKKVTVWDAVTKRFEQISKDSVGGSGADYRFGKPGGDVRATEDREFNLAGNWFTLDSVGRFSATIVGGGQLQIFNGNSFFKLYEDLFEANASSGDHNTHLTMGGYYSYWEQDLTSIRMETDSSLRLTASRGKLFIDSLEYSTSALDSLIVITSGNQIKKMAQSDIAGGAGSSIDSSLANSNMTLAGNRQISLNGHRLKVNDEYGDPGPYFEMDNENVNASITMGVIGGMFEPGGRLRLGHDGVWIGHGDGYFDPVEDYFFSDDGSFYANPENPLSEFKISIENRPIFLADSSGVKLLKASASLSASDSVVVRASDGKFKVRAQSDIAGGGSTPTLAEVLLAGNMADNTLVLVGNQGLGLSGFSDGSSEMLITGSGNVVRFIPNADAELGNTGRFDFGDITGTKTLKVPDVTDTIADRSWVRSLGGGTPGGSDTHVQFNDAGSLGGDADFVWNKTTNALTITGAGTYSGLLTANGYIRVPADGYPNKLIQLGSLSSSAYISTEVTTKGITMVNSVGGNSGFFTSGGAKVFTYNDAGNLLFGPGTIGSTYRYEFNNGTVAITAGSLLMNEQVTPATPPANKAGIYPGTDGLWRGIDDAGVVTMLSNVSSTTPGIDDVLAVGQALTANRTIATGAFGLTVSSATAGITPLTISSAGSGINVTAGTGSGINVSSTSGTGLVTNSTSSIAFRSAINPSSTNTVVTNMQIARTTSGTAANGLGMSIDLILQSNNISGRVANQLITKWTDATDATRTSQFEIWGVDSGISTVKFIVKGSGIINFPTPPPTYADDAAAGVGGLVAGDIYKTSTGQLQIKL
jgi:hypothetical protein